MAQSSQGFDPAGPQMHQRQVTSCWVFDAFRLDRRDERLWRGNEVIPLSPKTFAELCYLVSQAGHLVTKDALLEAVWPETAVSEAVIQVAIRLWSVPAQSGCGLPSTGRWRTARRRRAPFRSRPGLWTLGH